MWGSPGGTAARASGQSVDQPAASLGAPPRASSAASSGISPRTPAPTACCRVAGRGSRAAASWAPPKAPAYAASSPVPTGDRDPRAASAVTRAVPPSAAQARRAPAGPPLVSTPDSPVTTAVCAATVAAAGNAGTRPPAPSSTSSARAAAIVAGPAGNVRPPRSYAHTVAASGTATATERRPPLAAAAPSPTAVSPVASATAAAGRTRPDGIGRCGRSSASTSRSAQSLRTIPAQ